MKITKKKAGMIGVEELASLCNLSRRRIYSLAENNQIPKPVRGAFPMAETIRRLFASYQRESSTLSREKMLKTAAERGLREIELSVAQGKWKDGAEFDRQLDDFGAVVKQAILDNCERQMVGQLQGLLKDSIPESERDARNEQIVTLIRAAVDSILGSISAALESAHEPGAVDETSIESNTNESDD